jgi:predicted lipoprotein with Yx(FWY)xxD motif
MKRTLIALSLAISTAIAAPAMAGGTISFSIDAQNADDANAIRTGLALYSIFKDVKSNGSISQNGLNNMAALGQHGSGNVGVIQQDGNDHNAALNQTGNNNSYGIFQTGKGTNGQVSQTGNGLAGLLFQIGF